MFIHHGITARLYLQFSQTQQILSNTKSHEAAGKKKEMSFFTQFPHIHKFLLLAGEPFV